MTVPGGTQGETGAAGPRGPQGRPGPAGQAGEAGEAGVPDLRRVIAVIDTLSDELDGHKKALERADIRARWARGAAIVGIMTGAIGIIYGMSARATTDDIQDSRGEARVSSCVQANVSTEKTRAALVAGVSILAEGDRPPEAQARVDTFIANYTRSVEAALPYRDCSPAGLKRYFEHPPGDPAAR